MGTFVVWKFFTLRVMMSFGTFLIFNSCSWLWTSLSGQCFIIIFEYGVKLSTTCVGYILFHIMNFLTHMDIQNNDHNRVWKILSHNVWGINGQEKWNSLRNKIKETCCDIICLQETKCEHFEQSYLRKFCPRHYDKFYSHPSIGGNDYHLARSKSLRSTDIWKWIYTNEQVLL